MRLTLLLLFSLIAVPALAEETGEPRRMPASPEEVDTMFGEYWNAADAEGLASLYEPNAALIGLDGTVAQGTEAIRAAIASFGLGASQIEMKVVRVVQPSEDLAVLFNHWTIRGQNEDGSPLELSGRAMEIVRRQADGTWRFAVDHPVAGEGVGWSAGEAPTQP